MKKLFPPILSLVLTAILASACASNPDSPTAPSSFASGSSSALTTGQVSGTWVVQSIQRAGQNDQPTPANATYTITFAGDRFSTRADCNTCSGAYTIAGSTISVANAVACTRAACPTMDYESAYTGLLAGEHAVTAGPSTMVWSSARGRIQFSR